MNIELDSKLKNNQTFTQEDIEQAKKELQQKIINGDRYERRILMDCCRKGMFKFTPTQLNYAFDQWDKENQKKEIIQKWQNKKEE